MENCKNCYIVDFCQNSENKCNQFIDKELANKAIENKKNRQKEQYQLYLSNLKSHGAIA